MHIAGLLNHFLRRFNMHEIESGIRVYFENKKEFRNVVFFPDNTYTYYPTGGMLFELIRDDAIYMVTTKVENMIKSFPDYNAEASKESVTNGFKWLYGTIEDEELPIATELFRGCFNEVILDVADRSGSYECVGDFFVKCYKEYLSNIEAFSVYVDAIAAYNSGIDDEFQDEMANDFMSSAEELYDLYTRKCSVRHKNGTVTVDTVQMKNFLQVLI